MINLETYSQYRQARLYPQQNSYRIKKKCPTGIDKKKQQQKITQNRKGNDNLTVKIETPNQTDLNGKEIYYLM